jgi:hypothetical protein
MDSCPACSTLTFATIPLPIKVQRRLPHVRFVRFSTCVSGVVCSLIENMARPGRLELPTLCLEGRRSIQLSYGRVDESQLYHSVISMGLVALPSRFRCAQLTVGRFVTGAMIIRVRLLGESEYQLYATLCPP